MSIQRDVSLGGNTISDAGADVLAQALTQNPKLQRLFLGDDILSLYYVTMFVH
jgi:hypothetical protein